MTSALKKKPSGRKLSTKLISSQKKISLKAFDRTRFVNELLSLGHKDITAQVADEIGQEVEREWQRHPENGLTPEFISRWVETKLRDFSLLEEKKNKEKTVRIRKPMTPQALPSLVSWNEEEDTVSMPGVLLEETILPFDQNHGLLQKGKHTSLPTLEKFLRPIEGKAKGPASFSPPPPLANLKVDPAGLEMLRQNLPGLKDATTTLEHLRECFEKAAHIAASAEAMFPSKVSTETLAVEFFNVMANQEFYPHLPTLLGEPTSSAYGGHHLWIDLPLGSLSQGEALQDAKKIWEDGGTVSFLLDAPWKEGIFTQENFEHFIDAIEKAMLDLPETVSIPQWVGLHLSAENENALEFIRLALSGKYYPKFSFTLALHAASPKRLLDGSGKAGSGSARANPLLSCLEESWKKSDPYFLLRRELFTAFSRLPDRSGEIARRGGGPALEPYEACQLGSLNVSILANGHDVDWAKLRRMVRTAVHFLDNLVEVTDYPLEKVDQRSKDNRKIGLGIMGFADLLAKLGYPYDSENAQVLAEKLMRFIRHESLHASQALARDRGVFPNFSDSHWKDQGVKLRNASLNVIVPASETALLAGVTPGVGAFPSVLNPHPESIFSAEALQPLALLKDISTRRKIWNQALETEILEKGSVRDCTLAPQPLRRLFAKRDEISLAWQLRILAAFQKHCDGSMTAELNLSEDGDPEALFQALEKAWELGIPQVHIKQNHRWQEISQEESHKGNEETTPVDIQIFPEEENPPTEQKSVEAQGPEEDSTSDTEEASQETEKLPGSNSVAAAILGKAGPSDHQYQISGPRPRSRPEVLRAVTHHIRTGYGPMKVTIGYDEQGPYELTALLGNGGSHEGAQAEVLTRLTTLLLSVGVEPKWIFEQLRGIRCPTTVFDKGREVLSCGDGIAQILDREFSLSDPEEEPTVREILSDTTKMFRDKENEEEVTEVLLQENLH